MGKLDLFKVVLERDLYFPGEIIKGVVKLKVSNRFKINFIKLKFLANASVYW